MIISYSINLLSNTRQKTLRSEIIYSKYLIGQYEKDKIEYQNALQSENDYYVKMLLLAKIRNCDDEKTNLLEAISNLENIINNVKFVNTDNKTNNPDTSEFIFNTHYFKSLQPYCFAPSYPVRIKS